MYRVKDFMMMEVKDIYGKKVGFIKDIIINFNEGRVKGFVISPYNLFIKEINVLTENIVTFNESMIIKESSKGFALKFKEFKDMDVIDEKGNIVGMIEDIIFNFNYDVKGILISSGLLRKIFYGKKVAMLSEIIVGEENLLFIQKNRKYSFKSMPHRLMGDNCYER